MSVTGLSAQSSARTLDWSGYTWEIRRSSDLEGPGPNRFLDNRRTVWLDEQGFLHLKIWERLGTWYAAEVSLAQSLGYGTYVFETIGALDTMDPPVILGLFTYDDDPVYDHREIDIEYGRFGSSSGANAQFVVQPFDATGNRLQFTASLDGEYLTHVFRWLPDRVEFASLHGHHRAEVLANVATDASGLLDGLPDLLVAEWIYTGPVPPPGAETVHMNLWMYQSVPPIHDHEVVLRAFAFLPARIP